MIKSFQMPEILDRALAHYAKKHRYSQATIIRESVADALRAKADETSDERLHGLLDNYALELSGEETADA